MSDTPEAPAMEIPPELSKLEDLIGDFIQYWGFKKLHGRIWTHLFLSENPMDTQELMNRLGVSKGMMSIVLRELLEFQVIYQAEEGKYGTVLYRANPDLTAVITNVLRQRELPMLFETRAVCETLKDFDDAKGYGMISRKQLVKLMETTQSAENLLKAFLKFNSIKKSLDFGSILRSVKIRSGE